MERAESEWFEESDGGDDSGLHEACGVMGCVLAEPWTDPSFDVASSILYPALVNLQHRYGTTC